MSGTTAGPCFHCFCRRDTAGRLLCCRCGVVEQAAVSPLVPAPEPKIMEHAVKPTMSAAEVLAHPQPFPPLVPAPPEPQDGKWRRLNYLCAKLDSKEHAFEAHDIIRELRAAAARSPTPDP